MHISRLDLNLLRVLDAIASSGSITAASRELNLTQPAVSHALGRLREQLDDPLFIRDGRGLCATPYVREVLPDVRRILGELDRVLGRRRDFDPVTSTVSFTLAMHESMEPTILPALMERLQAEAPGVSLSSVKLDRRNIEKELQSGAVDFALDVLLPVGEQVAYALLGQEPMVVVARRKHPRVQKTLSVEEYFAERHILVSSRRKGPGYEDQALARAGERRKLALRARNHLAACQVVAGTDLLLTLPASYAHQIGTYMGLQVLPLPLSITPISSYLYWQRRVSEAPSICWLRTVLQGLMFSPLQKTTSEQVVSD